MGVPFKVAVWKNEEEWLAKGTSGAIWITGKWYVGHCDWCDGKVEYPDISGIHLINETTALKWAGGLEK